MHLLTNITSHYISPPTQCFKDINICTIFRKTKIHIGCAQSFDWKTVHHPANASSSLSSVKPLVPLLSLLENHSSHHSAHHDSQQRTQQKQEDLPAGEGRAAEVSSGIVDVVCEGRRKATVTLMFRSEQMEITVLNFYVSLARNLLVIEFNKLMSTNMIK